MKVIRKYHSLSAQDRRLITRILLHYSLRILHLAPRMNILAISAINPTGAQPDKNGAPPGVSSAPRSRLFFHFRSALRTVFTSSSALQAYLALCVLPFIKINAPRSGKAYRSALQ